VVYDTRTTETWLQGAARGFRLDVGDAVSPLDRTSGGRPHQLDVGVQVEKPAYRTPVLW